MRRTGRLADAHRRCLAGLERIEQTDHMYRDSFRVVTLLTLGLTALDQRDHDAARAAFDQAIAHVKGRPHTLGGGMLVIRALAGSRALTATSRRTEEACVRLEARHEFDFSWLWGCEERDACGDLAHAAHAVGRLADAQRFSARAVQSRALPNEAAI